MPSERGLDEHSNGLLLKDKAMNFNVVSKALYSNYGIKTKSYL